MSDTTDKDRTVYALLVGINAYPSPVPPLRGCAHDVAQVQSFLEQRVKGCVPLPLLNEQATRANVINAFRTHLGRAGHNDVALFYFSGHGAQQASPPEFWRLEPDHLDETLVCYDSRLAGGWDLADKELAQLIAEVAARGAHVVVILDCCHSGSGTRSVDDVGVRRAPTDTRQRPLASYLVSLEDALRGAREAGTDDTAAAWFRLPRGPHVLLAACRAEEEAKEETLAGQRQGVFTHYLLDALQQHDARITYRDLLTQVQTRVRTRVSGQSPLIEATDNAVLNAPFLGGTITAPSPYFTARHAAGRGWLIDGGAVHGIQPGADDERTVLAVFPFASADEQLRSLAHAVGFATVTRVDPGESAVTLALNDGVVPDPSALWKTVVVALPLPPVTVVLEGDAPALDLVRAALAHSGAAGDASPLVREVGAGEGASERQLRLTARDGRYTIRRTGDRYPLVVAIDGYSAASAALVAYRLEHIARWLTIVYLDNPTSLLPSNAVTLRLFAVDPATGREEATPLASGDVRLQYHERDGGWVPPAIKIELLNTTDQTLHCALLDLPETYGVFASLLPEGDVQLAPAGTTGDRVWAFSDRPIPVSIPNSLLAQGARALRDVVKLVVSTHPIEARWLTQDDLEVSTRDVQGTGGFAANDTLSRLMQRVGQRHVGQNVDRRATRPDWRCSDVLISTIYPPAAALLPASSEQRVDLGSGVTLSGHPALRASARLATAPASSRDTGNLALPAPLRDHPALAEPFAFTTSRAGGPPVSVLELILDDDAGASYSDVTPGRPLTLRTDATLEADEGVLALAFDGELFLPLGTFRRLAGGGTQIQLERLPAPTSAGQRSLGGAIRIFFQKVLTDKLNVPSAYPRLALPRVANDGRVSYAADVAALRARVAAAQRIVLYIHGIIGDTEHMARVAYGHRDDAGETATPLVGPDDLVLTFDYESINTKIERTAQDLKAKLQQIGLGAGHGKQLHIVAHSMGGLVSRWFIEKEGGSKVVQRLTMLGTPNGGSPWPTVQDWATMAIGVGINFVSSVAWPAKAIGWLVGAIEAVDEAFDEMKPGSDFLHGLATSDDPGVPYTILAGNTSLIAAIRQRAGEDGVQALERLLERLAPQHLLHQASALAFLQRPNDIAVGVASILAVPANRVSPTELHEIACDHLTYFTSPAGLQVLAAALAA